MDEPLNDVDHANSKQGSFLALLTKQVMVPVWALCIAGTISFFVLVAFLVALFGRTGDGYESEEDAYKVTGVDTSMPGISDMISNIHIDCLKQAIRQRAHDPSSIEWVEFRRLTEEDVPGVTPDANWIVWYRARNPNNALEMYKEGIRFKVFRTDKGEIKTDWSKIESIERLELNR